MVRKHQFSSVQFSRSVVSDSLRPHESQHTRPPCPSPTPGVHSDSCPSSQWCHPAISSSVVPLLLLPPSPPSIRVFSNEEKTSGEFKLKNILKYAFPETLKIGKIMENKERVKKCHKLEETKEIGQLNIGWCPVLKKISKWKNWCNLNKVYNLVSSTIYSNLNFSDFY